MSSVVHMNGGQALAEMFRLHNSAPMFGMGGFQLLPFYDAVRELGLSHTLINDERCGIFAADAWARVTGRPGICDGTLGPGATNLVTGLVESLNAGVPLIVVVGNSNREHSWKNMTQEARQTEILAPAAKALIRIESGNRIPELVRRAYAVATSGRPGPVVLDVPEDIAHGEYDYSRADFFVDPETLSIPAQRSRPGRDAVARSAERLRDARRPIILAGGGVHLSGAYCELQSFAEAFGIPVAQTLSGKGAIPCIHPLSVGLFGRWSRIANDLIESADCILSVGCKMGEIATKRYDLIPRDVPFIHLDIVAEEIGRTTPATVSLWGDAAEGLRDLQACLSSDQVAMHEMRAAYLDEISERMAAWRAEAEPRYASEERPVNMARLVRELQNVMPEDGILVVDGGFAAHWTGLLYDSTRSGRTYIANRGFASIGYGLPGTMGAQLAAGDSPVVGLTGDAGFNMVLGELETARRLELGFTLAIVNNAASGYVKALQHNMYEGRYQSSDLSETDYADTARALGCQGIRVDDPEALRDAFAEGIANRNIPTIIDVIVTRDPSKMLPGVDSRTAPVKKGDRPA
ncbi:MAG: thiamine pyrophosphate-binding protein [Candidatus Latescibacteria bacterium]|nr:thiamine pyrophosphate-binding protein [Candidatus Latescibacterota bacterium]